MVAESSGKQNSSRGGQRPTDPGDLRGTSRREKKGVFKRIPGNARRQILRKLSTRRSPGEPEIWWILNTDKNSIEKRIDGKNSALKRPQEKDRPRHWFLKYRDRLDSLGHDGPNAFI
jgi:hypothetical protein